MKKKLLIIGTISILITISFSGCQENKNSNTNSGPEEFTVNELGGIVNAVSEKVTFSVSAGAVTGQQTLTAQPATDLPSDPVYVPGTAYEFGPNGFQFEHPVQLTITYDESMIPAVVQEKYLMLAKLVDNAWKIIDDSTVDTAKHTVTGTISGFSKFGVVQDSAKVRIQPIAATCAPTGITELVSRLLGYPAGYQPQYQWNGTTTYGHIVIDPADYSKVTYVAKPDAQENGVDTIRLQVLGIFADENHPEGTPYVWGEATATVTIQKTTVKIEPSTTSCVPGDTVDFTAVVSNPPTYTLQYIWSCSNTNGKLVNVDPSKNSVSFIANSDAIEGGTDTLKVELWSTFTDQYHDKGTTYKWAEITATITIQKLSLSLNPTSTECPPGGQVEFNATVKNPPPNYVFAYKWTCTNKYGTLDSIAPNSHTISYVANTSALDGGKDTVKIELWTNFGQGNAYKWAEATATVTINKLSLSIDPASAECAPRGQKTFTAITEDLPPNYTFEYRWTCSNNNGNLVSAAPDNHSITYVANDDATNGSMDTIKLELWTTFTDTGYTYKWTETTATVQITTAPEMLYMLRNSERKSFMASGSSWEIFVNNKMVYSPEGGFYARTGDQLRISCNLKGAAGPEWNWDIYLYEEGRLLVSGSEIPDDIEFTINGTSYSEGQGFVKTFII